MRIPNQVQGVDRGALAINVGMQGENGVAPQVTSELCGAFPELCPVFTIQA